MNSRKDLIYFFRKYVYKQMWKIVLLLILVFIGVGISNLLPYIYGIVIDKITDKQIEGLEAVMFLYLAVALLATFLSTVESVFGEFLSWLLTGKMKMKLLEKMVYLRCKELDDFNEGELMSRLEGDVGTIVEFYLDLFTSILTIVFNLVISLIFIFKMSYVLAGVTLLTVPLSVMSNNFFRKKYRILQEKAKEYSDRVSTFEVELFHNLYGIKAYCQEEQKIKEYQNFVKEQWFFSRWQGVLSGKAQVVNTLISMSGTLILLYLSAHMIVAGIFTLGGMVSFMAYVSRLSTAVSEFLSLNMASEGVMVCMKRIRELDEKEDEMELYPREQVFHDKWTELKVQDVSFSYKKEQNHVLHHFSLAINKVGYYSIVGRNGCGKSSFLKLLMKYYEYSGTIKLGNQNLEDVGREELRKHIAYIPKEPYLLNQSILENIRLMKPDAGEVEVRKAAQMVGIEEFIESLPEKYETVIGESGKLLSSGQKQKLSVARASLCEPDIYLFDEVTSDLDGASEVEMVHLMRKLAKDKIIIHVTHRIFATESSDKIFLIDQGKIAESGTHEEMLKKSKVYAEIFQEQQAERGVAS